MTSSVLEGAVQLDRTQPLQVMLDTQPVTQLALDWRDVVGCWQLRVRIDPLTHSNRMGVVLELLVMRWHGVFVRVPGETLFWPSVELYGIEVSSLGAVAQRDQRAQRTQTTLALPAPASAGMKTPLNRRKKGRR